ncbi:cell wall assembly protein [Photobacterium jeanii]|uniref:Cell wall assembly protein n=1 Tax=Photobacterium jeanii TaxID=858640 RepID=A0A178KS76_9GAMM|nr:SMI1/KNR4 family protein [Photobacterium jeanii]OAN19775.1 cell wall assembly protein [Photobacterium jeanii]PST86082.1 SMI1/KNR4 family protein [Photobacterium jeanii]
MPFDLDEKFIVEAESVLTGSLPDSYRLAMMQSNGGELEVNDEGWEQYPILDKTDRKRLSRSCNNIITETESCKVFGCFPENAVAIASNGCGDQLVLLKEDNVYLEPVYLWCHETGDLTLVANKFSELARL